MKIAAAARATGQRLRATAPLRAMVQAVRRRVREAVPADATVLVAAKGDEELLRLGGRTGWHFPRTAEGTYAGKLGDVPRPPSDGN